MDEITLVRRPMTIRRNIATDEARPPSGPASPGRAAALIILDPRNARQPAGSLRWGMTEEASQPPERPQEEGPSATPAKSPRLTRAGAAWMATAFTLVLLVLLIIFILQNPDTVEVHFLWFSGTLALGMALFVAAVAGGVLVAVAGVARVTQLRVRARRIRLHGPDA